MWLVDKIAYIMSSGSTIYEQFSVGHFYTTSLLSTLIYLRNIETGDLEVLKSKSEQSYISQLRHYKPYGFIDNSYGSGSQVEDDVLVAVDDLSMQFLNYVSFVEVLRVPRMSEDYEFVLSLESGFMALDDECSLFTLRMFSGVQCACTLFHAMCYVNNGWRGDCFYLSSRTVLGNDGEFEYLVYRVNFCDVVAAKRFLAKAVLSKINPLSAYSGVDGRIM